MRMLQLSATKLFSKTGILFYFTLKEKLALNFEVINLRVVRVRKTLSMFCWCVRAREVSVSIVFTYLFIF